MTSGSEEVHLAVEATSTNLILHALEMRQGSFVLLRLH